MQASRVKGRVGVPGIASVSLQRMENVPFGKVESSNRGDGTVFDQGIEFVARVSTRLSSCVEMRLAVIASFFLRGGIHCR
jgi:hypothetical protein